MAKAKDKSWSLAIGRLAEAKGQDLATVARTATMDLFMDIAQNTPRDQGTLSANWQVSNGSPATSVIEATDSADRSMAMTEVRKVQDFQMGDVIWLSNNLPYARVVEDGLYGSPPGSANNEGKTVSGYSIQAPQGMVKLAVLNMQQYIRKAIRKVK